MKVEIYTLGCGQHVASELMGEGCSKFLESINILYGRDSIRKTLNIYPEDSGYGYVSTELVIDALLTPRNMTQWLDLECDEPSSSNDKRVIICTAALYVTGQRVSRENKFILGYIDVKDGGIVEANIYTETTLPHSRDGQEWFIADYIKKLVEEVV